jgi:hypothetical protein
MDIYSDELGKLAPFSEPNGNGKVDDRLKRRLAQNRKPTSRSASDQWVNWNSMAELLGQPFDMTKISLSKLEQMQRDPILSFGLMFIKVPLVRAPWYIRCTDAKRAAFVDNCLRRIYGRLILAYTNCFSFGYSAMVKRFEYENPDWTYVDRDAEEQPELPVWDSKSVDALVWKPFLALNPRYVTPHWSAMGDFAGIDFAPQSGIGAFGTSGSPLRDFAGNPSSKIADIPLDWALWATNEKDSVYGSLWGYPRLGYAYRYWWSYWYKFGLADRAFERWADPPMVVYHPGEDAYDTDGNLVDYSAEALAFAEKLRSGANGSLPSDLHSNIADDKITGVKKWEAVQIESKTNFDALDTTFKYLDVLKLRSMMVPEQSLIEGQGGSSSRNVAEKFGDIFQESQAIVMEEIDDLINRYMIPQLLEVNFGPGGPKAEKITTGFDSRDLETMRAIVGAIANKNGSVPEVDVREMLDQLGIPLLSWQETQRNLEKIAEEQQASSEFELQKLRESAALKGHQVPGSTNNAANSGMPTKPKKRDAKFGEAGVTEDGLYYNDRERIIIVGNERSEEDKETAKMTKAILDEVAEIKKDLKPTEPPVVNVEVKAAEASPTKKVRKTIVRDENGDISHVDEEEVIEDEQA